MRPGQTDGRPKMLPCYHTYCARCIGSIASRNSLCPVDRRPFVLPDPGGATALPDNFAFVDVLELDMMGAGAGVAVQGDQAVTLLDRVCGVCEGADAVAECAACDELLCAVCLTRHSKNKFTGSHVTTAPGPAGARPVVAAHSAPVMCPQHPTQPMHFF